MICFRCWRRPAVHQHHHVPQQRIKREVPAGPERRAALADPRNLVPLCLDCHFNHENWSDRITRDRLPAGTWDFARALGEWAVVGLERDYPVAT